MGSLLRTAKKHKKSRRLGEPEVMAREEYGELEVDVKIEMIRSLIPLGLMHVHELLDDEVKELAGERYARKDELERGRRHGTNPGTVGLAGQRVPIRVPRVRSQEGVEIPLRSYEALNDGGEVNDLLLKRVLYGISCRNYEAAAEAIPGAIGLSSSTVSRGFVQASAAKLREMQERDLSGEDVVALFLEALLHGSEQIADLPVPVAESPGAVRIGHPERGHLVEYLAPNSVFNSLPRQRSSPHLRPDDRLVTIDRVFHHASLGAA